MTFVAAERADAAAVVALWDACGLIRPWNDPQTDFARALAQPQSTVLVARREESIVAAVMVGDDGHRGWVYYLAVAPHARGQGLGAAAMDAAEAWLRARGCPKLQLMVRTGNSACEFYAARGLEPQAVDTMGRFL